MLKVYIKKVFKVWAGDSPNEPASVTECASREIAVDAAHQLLHEVKARQIEIINDNWDGIQNEF